MNLANDGSANDGSTCLRGVGLAVRAPSWVDNLINDSSAYGLGERAPVVRVAWWLGHVALAEAGLTAASQRWLGVHDPYEVRVGARLKDGVPCPVPAAA
ncbi:hypothetical protein AB0I93_15655 [Streptomyces sp. NPDC049967]|uniref:hypothetical protein n=1 Tax=unclassified Streptomyces TaxID=2593676 RepID=UPI002E2D1248|nr:hypothetical protein [Streptomyces sp. NBC_00342]